MAATKETRREKAGGEIFAKLYSNRMSEERTFPHAAELEAEFSENCQGLKVSTVACQKPGARAEDNEDVFAEADSILERMEQNRLGEEKVFPHDPTALGEFTDNCQGCKVILASSDGLEELGEARKKLADDVLAALYKNRRNEERVFPLDAAIEAEFSENCQGYRKRSPRF